MGRRRAPSLSAVQDQLISSGLQPDRHSLKRLLWESSANVIFWNGTVRRKMPPITAFDGGLAKPVRGIGQLFEQGGGRWLWAGVGEKILRWQVGAPETIMADFGNFQLNATSTLRPTLYDFVPYGNWMLVNNGVKARFYKPGTPATFDEYTPAEVPQGVTQFLKFMSFMMAFGFGARGTQVAWSDAKNIDIWTGAANNTAGSISIDEFNTPIRAARRLADGIAVYSEDQMAMVRYIGAPFIFGQKTTIDGVGAIGKHAVASDLKANVGMSRAGAWWSDGVSARYIDEGYISNYFQDNINWSQASKIEVGRNDETGCFEFHIPTGLSYTLNEAWSWDPRTGGWSPIPPKSCMDERRLFDHIVYGTDVGIVQLGDYDPTAAAPLSLVSKPLVMQDAESSHVVTRVDELDLLLHEAQNIEFQIGCCDEPNGDWEWTEWMEASVGARVYEIPELPEQPYWKLALRSMPGQNDWRLDLQGFVLYGIKTGAKM